MLTTSNVKKNILTILFTLLKKKTSDLEAKQKNGKNEKHLLDRSMFAKFDDNIAEIAWREAHFYLKWVHVNKRISRNMLISIHSIY